MKLITLVLSVSLIVGIVLGAEGQEPKLASKPETFIYYSLETVDGTKTRLLFRQYMLADPAQDPQAHSRLVRLFNHHQVHVVWQSQRSLLLQGTLSGQLWWDVGVFLGGLMVETDPHPHPRVYYSGPWEVYPQLDTLPRVRTAGLPIPVEAELEVDDEGWLRVIIHDPSGYEPTTMLFWVTLNDRGDPHLEWRVRWLLINRCGQIFPSSRRENLWDMYFSKYEQYLPHGLKQYFKGGAVSSGLAIRVNRPTLQLQRKRDPCVDFPNSRPRVVKK